MGTVFSCKQTKNNLPTFGEIDVENIAQDTLLQTNLDKSFEFVKILVLNDSTVIEVKSQHFFESDLEVKKTYIFKKSKTHTDTIWNKTFIPEIYQIEIYKNQFLAVFFKEKTANEKFQIKSNLKFIDLTNKFLPINLNDGIWENKNETGTYQYPDSLYLENDKIFRNYPIFLKNSNFSHYEKKTYHFNPTKFTFDILK